MFGLFPGPDGPVHAEAAADCAARAPSARGRGDAGRARVRRARDGVMQPALAPGRRGDRRLVVVRRTAHGRGFLALGALAAVGAALIGFGVVELPDVEELIEDVG